MSPPTPIEEHPMTRIYERETKHYDFAVLTHLVETGQATFFEGPGIFVVKTEDGTVAVRPHQVIFTATPAPFDIVVPDEPVAEVEIPVIPEVEAAPSPAPAKKGWITPQEQDDILGYFGL
jgi:hypothetical protein